MATTTAPEIQAKGTTTGELAGAGGQGDSREFPCEQCGAKLAFSIGQQTLACPYCGHEKALEIAEDQDVGEQDFSAMIARLEEGAKQRVTQVADKEVTCTTCGGTVAFSGNLTTAACTYCGGPIHREDVHAAENRIPPDGILPFMVQKQRARDGVAEWVKSRWFAPNEFKERGAHGKFDGVYLPYWTYDSMTFSRYRGERGEQYWETEKDSDGNERRVMKIRWYPASGRFSRFFDDVLVSASDRMPQKLLEELEPWPFEHLMPFTPDVMAGYLAQSYTVGLEPGWQRARGKIDDACLSEAKRRIGGDIQRVHWINTLYNAITFKYLLLPVWLMTYRFGDKSYRVCVNACTGEVIGERPWSWIKIALAVLAAVVIVAAIALVMKNR